MTYTQEQIRSTIAACPETYMTKSLEQRNPGPLSAGSTFHTPQTRESLMAQEWVWYPDPDCRAPAISFRARLSGKLGIAPLSELPPDMNLILRPAHKGQNVIEDKKSQYDGELDTELVGNVSQHLADVDYSTLMCGPTKDSDFAFWTVFPGPCSFSWPKIGFQSLQRQYCTDQNSIKVTVSEALELGFKNVKHSTEC